MEVLRQHTDFSPTSFAKIRSAIIGFFIFDSDDFVNLEDEFIFQLILNWDSLRSYPNERFLKMQVRS